MEQAAPLQPLVYNSRADLHPAGCKGSCTAADECEVNQAATPGEPTQEQTLECNCSPWTTVEQVVWQELLHVGVMLDQIISEGLHAVVQTHIHWSSS